MLPSPEQSRKWLGLIWPMLVQGGPAVSLLLLLLGAVQVWYLLGALSRAQGINRELLDRYLACHTQQVELALKVAHCPPPP